ncbi:MAG: hypothetical protein LZF60_170062 [Nitrospira sp.]|nr:MAG: hypothetical protein LZF60_170062 [Nitrospira sp.]
MAGRQTRRYESGASGLYSARSAVLDRLPGKFNESGRTDSSDLEAGSGALVVRLRNRFNNAMKKLPPTTQ